MSKENVEVVRRIVDAHQRGDFASVFAAYDPAIEWHTGSVGAQWSGDSRAAQWSDFEPVYHGHEGVRTFWRTWFAAWETVDFQYEEFIRRGRSGPLHSQSAHAGAYKWR